MSIQVDWSKAREWAVAFAFGAWNYEIHGVWVGEDQYQRDDQLKPFLYGGRGGDTHHNPQRSQFWFEVPRPAKCDGNHGGPRCADPECWNDAVAPDWDGQGLPPVGSTVRIVKNGQTLWPDAEQFIGADCTLCAVFKTGDTLMVAVEHQANCVCCCFQAAMVRTPEQERAKAVRDMGAVIARDEERRRNCCAPCARLAIEALYDAGCRLPEGSAQ